VKYEPKVMKLYAKHITGIFDMPRSAQKVLGYILDNMNDENEITIASGGKTRMLEVLDMKSQTLNNSLCKLVQLKILANPYKGVYVANPEIFTYKKKWGDTLNQQKKFRAMIKYTKSSFTITGGWDD
jgi:hypothetical protein